MSRTKRILVVDDESRNRRLLRAMLKSLGYSSDMACDGPDALSKLGKGFDLVLLDLMMFGMDGFEVARRIRSQRDHADIPIIMVTVSTSKEDRLEAVRAGANDFISKPVDKVELSVRVASLLKMKEAQDEIKRHRSELEVTVEKRTAALRESEERLRSIFEAAQDCIFVQDRDLRYTQVNPAMQRLFGRNETEFQGLTSEDLFGTENARHDREVAGRVLGGEVVEQERTRAVNGVRETFLETRVPIRDAAGKITGLCGIFRNVTERRTVQNLPRDGAQDGPISASMRRTLEQALLVAVTDSTVLLMGESGSGKDYLARFIHNHSRRATGPFFMINCAAVASELAESELFGHESGAFTGANRRKRGLVELAEGGTLLLNEIGELSPLLQAKLLTFLDSKTFTRVGGEKSTDVSVRIIAATNRNLPEEVARKAFRSDLLYRLSVYAIVVPPLRERTEDIPLLAKQIMAELTSEMQLEHVPHIDSFMERQLSRYSWPGNVRELRNVLERSLILANRGRMTINLGGMEQAAGETVLNDWKWTVSFPPEKPFTEMATDMKRSLIQEALDQCNGNRTQAACLLKVTRDTLKRQMKTLGFFS